MLGMGGSDKSQKLSDYSGRAIAQCVVEIMSAEGVEKAIVIGHDWGSIFGSRLALFYPSKVMALVLVAVPYWTPGSFALDAVNTKTEKAFGFPIFGYWDVLMNQKHLLEKHANSFLSIIFAEDPEIWKKHFVAKGALKKWPENDCECVVGSYVIEIEKAEFLANDWAAATQYYHCYAENWSWNSEKDLLKDKHIIPVPSFMIAASDDACALLPLVDSTLADFADIKRTIIEGGHHIHLSQVDKFLELVKSFLEETGVCLFSS